MDHSSITKKGFTVGVVGFKHLFVILDLYCTLKAADPCDTHDSDEVIALLNRFMGKDLIELIHSDSFSSFRQACTELHIQHRESLPGVPQSNVLLRGLFKIA